MIVIQHRANSTKTAHCEAAEIDVQIDRFGDVVVSHDLWRTRVMADYFLKHSKHERFFIDIKQNLPLEKLQLIAKTFGTRSMGLFDVPFPSAYSSVMSGLDTWGRISEFEPLNHLFNKFWVDPLACQNAEVVGNLIDRTQLNHRLIVASPELHGHGLDRAHEVWDVVKEKVRYPRTHGHPIGIVTKFPKEAEEFFNGKRVT